MIQRSCGGSPPTTPPPSRPTSPAPFNNLGIRLSNLGRGEQALPVAEEGIEIYRRLATAHPAAFEPDLARSLWAFAWVCAAGKIDLDQGLVSAREAVDIYARLVRQLPAAFTGDLRSALGTMADILDGLDRHDEAAEVRRSLDDLADGGE